MIKYKNIFKIKREVSGFSLEEVSSKIGINKNNLKKVENFSKMIPYNSINSIQELLDITDSEINEYFSLFSEIEKKEKTEIRKNITFLLGSLGYSIAHCVFTCCLGYKHDYWLYMFISAIIASFILFSSFGHICASRGFIHNSKFFILLIISIFLFIISIIAYFLCCLLR